MPGRSDPELAAAFGAALQAIVVGDLDALTTLLDQRPALVHARSVAPPHATLLHYTAFNGLDEVCATAPPTTPTLARLLMQRGAAPDPVAHDRGAANTPLCWALSSWHTHAGGVQVALADAYLDGGARIEGVAGDGAPLGHAIGFGYTRAVEALARRGARTDHLLAAAALGDVDRLSAWLRPDGTFHAEALAFACAEQRERGRFSWPPPREPDAMALALVTAAMHGRLEAVRFLLERGARVSGAASLDQTALHFAAYIGHPAVVELLLERGARTDIRERQFGRTPAEWARETGEDTLAARLTTPGAG